MTGCLHTRQSWSHLILTSLSPLMSARSNHTLLHNPQLCAGSWGPSSCLLVQMRQQQTSPVIIFARVPVRWGSNQMFHAYLMRIFSFPAKWGAEEPRSLAAATAWTCCEGCWLQPFSTSAHLEIFCNVMYIVHFGSRDERSSEIVWCAFQSGRNKIHFYNLIGLYLVSAQCI